MSETAVSGCVLHVDDDDEFVALTAASLEQASDRFDVTAVTNASQALDRLDAESFDCVVTGYELPESNGLDLLDAVRERDEDLPVILCPGAGSEAVASEAIARGVTDYLTKRSDPDGADRLAARIETAVEKCQVTRVDRLRRLVGEVDRVLVRGETRAEIERGVCRTIGGPYRIAWLGTHDDERGTVHPRATGGELDDIEITSSQRDLAKRARRAGELVVSDIESNDYRAAAVPLVVDDRRFGVLSVSTDRADAFGERERETLAELGTDIAHALARVCHERRRRQFQSAVEHAGHVVLITDAEGTITYVNDAFESATGYTAEEAVGRKPSMLQSDNHSEAFYRDLWETISSGEVWEGEIVNERKDGQQYVIDQTIAPLTDDTDDINGFVAINRNVTERKERELNLAFLKQAIDQAGIGIGTYDADGYATYVNERLANLFGTDRDDLRKRHLSVLDPDLDSDRFSSYWESFDDGERRIYDTRIERVDTGETVPVEVVTSRVVIDGDPFQVNTVRDAADRKRQERELKRFRSAVEHAGHSVLITDETGTVEYVNDAFERTSGYSAAEAIGRTPAMLHSGEHDEAFYRDLWETILDGDVWQGEVTNERKDGTQYVVDQTIAPLVDDADSSTGFVAINRDVTALKEYERELEAQNDRLKEYGQTVAHDLRNPLSLLDAELQHFEATLEPTDGRVGAEAVRNLCTDIGTTVDRMEALIDDLLAMAEQGQRVLSFESTSLESVATEAWAQVDTGAATLAIDDTTVEADPDGLRELLSNLFRNSVEHGSTDSRTESGESVEHDSTDSRLQAGEDIEHAGRDLTVRVTPLDFSAGFAVEDDGPGIPEDERADAFERGFTTAEEGTGFGLAIVEQIAHAHDWTVSVTEGRDGGARFEFRTDG